MVGAARIHPGHGWRGAAGQAKRKEKEQTHLKMQRHPMLSVSGTWEADGRVVQGVPAVLGRVERNRVQVDFDSVMSVGWGGD